MPIVACDIHRFFLLGLPHEHIAMYGAHSQRRVRSKQYGQHCRTRTWYVLSNLSYMKRVMIDVLPTDWSPRNTCTGAMFE